MSIKLKEAPDPNFSMGYVPIYASTVGVKVMDLYCCSTNNTINYREHYTIFPTLFTLSPSPPYQLETR